MLSSVRRLGPKKASLPLVALLLLPPAVVLVQLQAEVTNQAPWSQNIFGDYHGGALGLPADARVLMRVLVSAVYWISGTLVSPLRAQVALETLFLAGALLVLYSASARHAPWSQPIVAPLLAVAFLPWGFLKIGYQISYPYDIPALFFCSLGILAILGDRYPALLATMVVGTLNKETMFWLIPGFLFYEWLLHRGPRGHLFLQVAAVAGCFLLAYALCRVSTQGFRGLFSPVGQAGDRWVTNLNELGFSNRGRLMQNVYWPLLIHLPALLWFRRLPMGIRALYAATPVFLVPMFVYGNLHELRLYNEILPLGCLANACLLPRSEKSELTAV